MSVLTIRKARREGARVVIILAGVSGSGKTRTALEIAYGLADYDPSKIGFLDAENRRGSLYADVFSDPSRERPSDVPFLIGDLYAPFSPDRYIEAIQEFQRAKVQVLVIDSGSHEWEGIGGCSDIANAGNPRMPNWNKAKGAHKKFMNAVLTCDMHIILCLRAREKAVPEEQIIDGQKKTVYRDMGLQAITEKNVLFEATASLMLHDEGKRQDVVKCPGALQAFLGRGKGYVTDGDGQALRRWIDGAAPQDPAVEHARNSLLNICEQGMPALEAAWKALTAKVRKALGEAFIAQCKASAAGYEQIRRDEAAANGKDGDLDDLSAAVTGVAADSADDEEPGSQDEQPPAAAIDPGAELYA